MERLPLFDEYFSRDFLRPHIQAIAETVSRQLPRVSQPGWMTGLAGMAVFLAEYEDWCHGVPVHVQPHLSNAENGQPHGADLTDVLGRIVYRNDDGFTFPTLAAGLTGILFTFHYLGDRGLIDRDDAKALDEIIPFLEKYATHELKSGNYDPLHGGTGPYLLDIVRAAPCGCPSPHTSAHCGCPPPQAPDLDLGLAHGLPSYLLFLKKINCEESIINPLANDLLSHADFTQKNGSIFPSKIVRGVAQYPSRLAWCYGDAGVGISLLCGAQGMQGIQGIQGMQGFQGFWEVGVRVLLGATLRRDALNTRVEDPFLCHGASGLALIFYKAWLLSKNDKFKEAAQFWTQETLNYLNTSFAPGDSSDTTLLNGLSGIGLVLMAIDRGFLPGWEKGLLI